MSIYRSEYHEVARRAFSMWNRDAASPSFGSFDRLWWGWKFKDFGDATLQYAARLTLAYAEETGRTASLPALVGGFVEYVKQIQHRDGSFDQCYPNERTPGVIYDILSTLVTVRQSRWITENDARDLDEIMRNAVTFCLRTDEKHGEVANHIAEFAYELLHYAKLSGDERARRRGEQYLERLLRLYDREEGWFHEYHGPDGGYQTRALRYVVKCAAIGNDAALWEVAERAGRFAGEILMPDGSVHPMLGVRSTALVYPAAFEILACRHNDFRSIADRIRYAWEQRRVPLPSMLDFQNAIRLGDDAREAAELAGEVEPLAAPPAVATGERSFENAGIVIRRTDDTALYVATRLGGVVVLYARDADGQWRLRYEDSGYLLRDGESRYVTRAPNGAEVTSRNAQRIVVRAGFQRSLHDEVTPVRMVLLRILNLTVLRSQWIGDLFRKVVVKHLMGESEKIDLTLEREIVIEGDGVVVRDRISGPARGRLFRGRRITGMHMASSRYFLEDELAELPLEWLREIPWSASGETTSEVAVRI